jgi:alpha-beta hydrolase superfamily lysophospholipase
VLVVVVAVMVVAACGTGPAAVEARRVPADVGAAELDAWLAERESAVADVVPGTAKTILWADEEPGGRRTDIALIYLHGFSATRRELSPTVEQVGEALGANVFFTRLAGHGRTAEALGEATVEDWKADVREAWEIGRRIGERVVVIGTSTGASLALWLATQAEFAAQPAALVLVSPNFAPADRRARVLSWPGGAALAWVMTGRYFQFEPENERHARYWTERYPSSALVDMMGAAAAGADAALERVATPTLMLYTEQDDVVSVPALKEAYGRIGAEVEPRPAKKLVEVAGATQHVPAGDILSPQTTQSVIREMTRFLRARLR